MIDIIWIKNIALSVVDVGVKNPVVFAVVLIVSFLIAWYGIEKSDSFSDWVRQIAIEAVMTIGVFGLLVLVSEGIIVLPF